MSEATAAATRKIAGAGMRRRALSRLDSSANETTAAATSSASPNGSMSCNTAPVSPLRRGTAPTSVKGASK